jgi:uncharacterized protein YjbI with pentapeptide repeats
MHIAASNPPITRTPDQVVVGAKSLADLLWEHSLDGALSQEPQVIPERTDLKHLNLAGKRLRGALLRRLDLSGADLSSADLAGADLSGSDLSGAYLNKVNMAGAILVNANLQNAQLEGADLKEANLRQSILCHAGLTCAAMRGAKLEGADFRGATLASADLRDIDADKTTEIAKMKVGGADLSSALLPGGFPLAETKSKFQDVAGAALNTFFFFAAGLAYSMLMAFGTTDDKLLPKGGTSPLPFLQTAVPTAAFFLVTPVVLLLPYAYVHFNFLRFFRVAAELPEVFPDGASPCEFIRPWMLSALLQRLVTPAARYRQNAWTLERWFGVTLTSCLIWLLTPALIFVFWFRYLVFHRWPESLFLEVLGLSALAMSFAFQWYAFGILRPFDSLHQIVERRKRIVAILAILTTGVSICSARHWLDFGSSANFEARDVTIRPDKFDADKPLEVRGAYMVGADLRNANARSAFLVHGDFNGASLDQADFSRADLRGADFTGATLTGVNFSLAQLQQATFAQGTFFAPQKTSPCAAGWAGKRDAVRFDNANLTQARLVRPQRLCGASFTGATLDNTDFTGIDLSNSEFSYSQATQPVLFKSANLTGARMISANLTKARFNGATLDATDFHDAYLTQADFSDTIIKNCPNAQGVDLTQAAITPEQFRLMSTDEHTRPPFSRPADSTCPLQK